MLRKMREILKGTKGQGIVEYVLIIALIALAVVVSMQALKGKVSAKLDTAGTNLASAT